jgi:hypothetical protein
VPSDELARIQDAVNAVDAVTAPYGVNVAEVTNPTQANVTLNMGTTSEDVDREAQDWLNGLNELCGPHTEVEDIARWYQLEKARLEKLTNR